MTDTPKTSEFNPEIKAAAEMSMTVWNLVEKHGYAALLRSIAYRLTDVELHVAWQHGGSEGWEFRKLREMNNFLRRAALIAEEVNTEMEFPVS